MLFEVRCYKGPASPQGGYKTVEAESAKEAAEKRCGKPLTEKGARHRLRAMVKALDDPPSKLSLKFFAMV